MSHDMNRDHIRKSQTNDKESRAIREPTQLQNRYIQAIDTLLFIQDGDGNVL